MSPLVPGFFGDYRQSQGECAKKDCPSWSIVPKKTRNQWGRKEMI